MGVDTVCFGNHEMTKLDTGIEGAFERARDGRGLMKGRDDFHLEVTADVEGGA